MSSTFGKNIKIAIFGQSHSEAIGVTIDGLPAGLKIDMEELEKFLARRAPGNSPLATNRKEGDKPKFICGLLDNITCGAPLTALIENTNTNSKDYSQIADMPRPSHSDFAAHVKYRGFNDVRGGGHFSGRLTAPLCIAGGICKQILASENIEIFAHIKSIKDVSDDKFDEINPDISLYKKTAALPFPVLNKQSKKQMEETILKAKEQGDSVGGTIECMVTGLPAGVGEPMFEGFENRISAAVFAIPAVKGIEFGNGFDACLLCGSGNNDSFHYCKDGVKTLTNNSGGINGGISNGMPLVFTVGIKPTPSIFKKQRTISFSEKIDKDFSLTGRHDPCIVPRAVPCVEAAAAIAVYDLFLDFRK